MADDPKKKTHAPDLDDLLEEDEYEGDDPEEEEDGNPFPLVEKLSEAFLTPNTTASKYFNFLGSIKEAPNSAQIKIIKKETFQFATKESERISVIINQCEALNDRLFQGDLDKFRTKLKNHLRDRLIGSKYDVFAGLVKRGVSLGKHPEKFLTEIERCRERARKTDHKLAEAIAVDPESFRALRLDLVKTLREAEDEPKSTKDLEWMSLLEDIIKLLQIEGSIKHE